MNVAALAPLVQATLFTPRQAAAVILAYRPGRDVLWTALALVAALNTLILVLLLAASPPQMALPGYFEAPLALFFLLTGLLVIYVYALYWAGWALGGQGDIDTVLMLVIWLQSLRAAAQLAILLIALLLPPLGMILSLMVAVWGVWILLNFIVTALQLPTLFHAIATLVVAGIGLILGLGLLISFIGITAQGLLPHV
ncbi:YIP1 family protein [Sulfitobacter aestuarii]|uniref:YIP1 family protein n=1 Tax=Sulfitobacter aestuarii TaxID=2161676 RepID=A0ABW5U272_9RHOB